MPPLPTPDDLPEAEILIFDGMCRFCQRQVASLRRIAGDRVAYLSLHDAETGRRFPHLSFDDLMREMVLVDCWGRTHGGAAAIRHLSRRVPFLWPLAPLLHIPGTLRIWQRLYQWVAVRRYRWSQKYSDEEQEAAACDEDACSVHMHK